ncbi:hypothetical protein KHA94_21510 [Bacillus sp. FJAT-49705]|uniref:DUF7852 domain-containing protein n=1 Tax=Cytobacillus citreus TaxID=2833586 RepID=A0ABS5P043_9BACI|nr:hypothetical protein [Cytobacillus citreus]MBS4192723.1 hypothetical protein [Cytobacillus citreus]
MRKNTCGCHGHDHCPPQMECKTVKSVSGECKSEDFFSPGEFEQTVVLNDIIIQIPVEADIKLPAHAKDLKLVKKNVKLKQCKVVKNSFDPTHKSVKLFIEGVVHKNIQFVESCDDKVRDFSVSVPFRCFRKVHLNKPAQFPFGEFSIKKNVLERKEIAKNGHGADECITGSLTFEVFTEPVECKLLFAVIDEWDIFKKHDSFGRFRKITEKMDVVLGIKLFQKQQCPEPEAVEHESSSFEEHEKKETIFDRFRGMIG